MLLKLLMVLFITFMSKHPSTMCLSLVMFCMIMSFYLKSVITNIHAYIILIIFVGGILLLLFYLTMISSNKPSWYMNFFILILMLPEFLIMKNLKFSSFTFSLEMFYMKTIFLLILIMLCFMLFMIYLLFSKISFMRELN